MHNSCSKAFCVLAAQLFISLWKESVNRWRSREGHIHTESDRGWERASRIFFSIFSFVSIIELNDVMKNDFIASVFSLLPFIPNRLPLLPWCLCFHSPELVYAVAKIFNDSNEHENKKRDVAFTHTCIFVYKQTHARTVMHRMSLVGAKKWFAEKNTTTKKSPSSELIK